jgi:hypothetical protein
MPFPADEINKDKIPILFNHHTINNQKINKNERKLILKKNINFDKNLNNSNNSNNNNINKSNSLNNKEGKLIIFIKIFFLL